MSVEYGAKIMVGLQRGDLFAAWDEEKEERYGDLSDLIHDGDLDSCPLRYDGDGDDETIVGVDYLDSGDFSACVLNYDGDKVQKLKKKFHDMTGLEAKVWLCTHGH